MSQLTLKDVTPDHIDIRGGLVGSPLNVSELETITCNVIVLSRWHGSWFSFTWEEYKALCKHRVTQSEKVVLDQLVGLGVLSISNDKYAPTDRLIETLKEYII